MSAMRTQAGRLRAPVVAAAAALVLFVPMSLAKAQCTTYTKDADFNLGLLNGVHHDAPNGDQLQLNVITETFPFAWIANAEEGTVSKVNTLTGREVARYYPAAPTAGGAFGGGQSPSRTAVDKDGNCWAAMRHFGGEASVTQILIDGGIDRNGNGTIETSQDLNNDGVISGAELLPFGQDERVARRYRVGGGSGLARALTIDKTGFLWVGLFNEHRVLKLDPNLSLVTYAPLANGHPPELASVSTAQTYGLATAPNSRLYLSTISNVVQEIDPGAASGGTDPPRVLQTVSFVGTNYGIAADRFGIVWMADLDHNRCIRWDPALGGGGITYGGPAPSRGRGITVDFEDNIWMACDLANRVVKYARIPSPPVICASAAGCSVPIGVGITSDGRIISVGQASNSWGRVNGAVCALDPTGGPQSVGSGPYTYSDFTGSLFSILNKQGFWTVVQDAGTPGQTWGRILWTSNEPESTSVTVEARASDDSSAAGLGSQTYVAVANNVAFTLTGQYIQVRTRLTTDRGDLASPVLYDLTICTSNQPPDCSAATAIVSWPPNHKLMPVTIAGVTDPDGDPITIVATGVTQDEPVEGLGDGDTCPDATLVNGAVQVRRERGGPGNGRVYKIAFTATDPHGASCDGVVSVCVPHDQRAPIDCVDDGQTVNSLSSCSGTATALAGEPAPLDLQVVNVHEGVATIQYRLPVDGDVRLDVYDVAGRQVANLENSRRPAGVHAASWGARGLPRGMYFYRLQFGGQVITKSVLHVK